MNLNILRTHWHSWTCVNSTCDRRNGCCLHHPMFYHQSLAFVGVTCSSFPYAPSCSRTSPIANSKTRFSAISPHDLGLYFKISIKQYFSRNLSHKLQLSERVNDINGIFFLRFTPDWNAFSKHLNMFKTVFSGDQVVYFSELSIYHVTVFGKIAFWDLRYWPGIACRHRVRN